jgi:two-component system response regulator AtoC
MRTAASSRSRARWVKVLKSEYYSPFLMNRKNQTNIKVLVVDDDEKILFAFKQLFKKEGYACAVAESGAEALKKLASEHPRIIFMDIAMPELDGLETLQRMKANDPAVPVIMITGHGTMQSAIKAIQLGAFDYLTKPLDVSKVRDIIRQVLSSEKSSAGDEHGHLPFKADYTDRYELIGNSKGMQEVYKLIGSISTTTNHTSVLILGESGTGKELVARAIHAHSPTAHEPFVGINCTVLPESLLESELFGHQKGAFTGAVEKKIGKFEVARRGTIFLDEIGDLSSGFQQKLLRVLQEREFERVGGNEIIPVEGRFITATNRDIEHDVKQGKFRKDLFYRFNVVTIHLPPLRERSGDIPLLANYFLSRYNVQLKKSVKGFSADSVSLLESYRYPGNVRELENLIERAVMLAKGNMILPDVFADVLELASRKETPQPVASAPFKTSREKFLAMFEKQYLVEQLSKHHGNVSASAKASGMSRQNFQRLMTRNKIGPKGFR